MPTTIAIETATDAASVALLHENKITERFEIAPRRHTDLVLPMIESLLNEKHLRTADIQLIAFGEGPGSFMGTRLATSIAQGLGYALNCPLIPISTLQILAQTAFDLHGCEHVVAAWDARMSEIYWGVYFLQEDRMKAVRADALNQPQDVVIPESCVLVGNVADQLKNASRHIFLYPRASSLITILQKDQHIQRRTALDVEPVYLRAQIV